MLVMLSPSGALAAPERIYMIPKGSQHLFWEVVHAGAKKAARELGVELYFRGPGEDDNRFGQERLMRRAIDQGYDGIVLAPSHDRHLLPLVEEALARGVPVVVIDSALQGDAHRSFVATDNYRGGYLAGEAMRRLLNGQGRVVLLRYLQNNASTENRERGFIDALEGSGVEIVAQGYVGASVGEAARNGLVLLGQAGRVDGVFAPNESSTEGILLALRSIAQDVPIRLVGFDYSPRLLAALHGGELQALVLQQPFEIGYQGVRAAVAALRQQVSARTVLIDPVVMDRSNYERPDIQAIIQRSRVVEGLPAVSPSPAGSPSVPAERRQVLPDRQ